MIFLQLGAGFWISLHIAFMLGTAIGIGTGHVESCGENIPLWICIGPFADIMDALDEGVNLLAAIAGGYGIFSSLWSIISMNYEMLNQDGFFGTFGAIIRILSAVAGFSAIVYTILALIGSVRIPFIGGR